MLQIRENWDEHFGDRCQKLVFIGKKDILGKIKLSLENCLLDDAELTSDMHLLKKMKDPFGDWNDLLESQEVD